MSTPSPVASRNGAVVSVLAVCGPATARAPTCGGATCARGLISCAWAAHWPPGAWKGGPGGLWGVAVAAGVGFGGFASGGVAKVLSGAGGSTIR
eukprot:896034-Prymnesium_polylepis.1